MALASAPRDGPAILIAELGRIEAVGRAASYSTGNSSRTSVQSPIWVAPPPRFSMRLRTKWTAEANRATAGGRQ